MSAVSLPSPQVFNRDLARCWQALQGGTTIAVYKCLVDVTGSIKTAVFLSQLLYWTRVGTEIEERDGWIHKTISQMERETGLTKAEQRLCKARLLELELIRTKRTGMGAQLSFKIDLHELARQVCQVNGVNENPGLSILDLQRQNSLFFRRYFSQRIAYHRDLVSLTGCIHAAIMLSHMMRIAVILCDQQQSQHAFASLTISDWLEQLMLPYKSQRTARNRLKDLCFIVEKHFYASRRIFTLIHGKNILAAVRKHLGKAPNDNSLINKDSPSLANRANSVWRIGQNSEFNDVYLKNFLIPKNMTFGSAKRANSEVSKGQIKKCSKGKLRDAQRGNKEVSKGQIIYRLDYLKFSYENNYNIQHPQELQPPGKSVVVVGSVNFEKLIYPQCLSDPGVKDRAIHLFRSQLPQADESKIQEILDEIAGQSKKITSPLNLLNTLIKLECDGKLICTAAPFVQKQRQEIQAYQAYQRMMATTAHKAAQPPSDVPRSALAMLNAAKKAKSDR